jgi:hypothetical protein
VVSPSQSGEYDPKRTVRVDAIYLEPAIEMDRSPAAGSRQPDREEASQRAHPTCGVNFNQSGTRSGLYMPAVT